MNDKIISYLSSNVRSLLYYSLKYFWIALIRTHFYPDVCDYTWWLPGTCRGYVTLVLPKSCLSSALLHRSIHRHTCCPSMVLLSLCIKPLSPITLTPRWSRSIRIYLLQLPHLSQFHPWRFIEASTPSSTGSSRSGCLARSLASISAGCIAKSIAVWGAERGGRGWGVSDGGGGQGGFREGWAPSHFTTD